MLLFLRSNSPVSDSSRSNPFEPGSLHGLNFGEFQEVIEEVANTIPSPLKRALRDITFINGCHPWSTAVIGQCPYGTFDSAGWDADNSIGHPWANTIWISSAAAQSDELPDVIIHEVAHAFVHHHLSNCYFFQNEVDSVEELLFLDFAHDEANPAELLADAFTLVFGSRGENSYTYYLDKHDFVVQEAVMSRIRAAVSLCSK